MVNQYFLDMINQYFPDDQTMMPEVHERVKDSFEVQDKPMDLNVR